MKIIAAVRKRVRGHVVIAGILSLLPVAAQARTLNVTTLTDNYISGQFYEGNPLAPIPQPGTLRNAITGANLIVPLDEEVIINLTANATYVLARSTTYSGVDTESDEAIDPWNGDLDIRRSLTINGNGATIDAGRLGRIFHITGNIEVTLRNMTLKGGGFSTLDGGGAIRISGGAKVVLQNVKFQDHLITGGPSNPIGGGAVTITGNSGGEVRMTGCHFENCRVVTAPALLVAARGGAIYFDGGKLIVEGTTFRQCHARQDAIAFGGEARGGAVYAVSGELKFTESGFEENSTLTASGGDATVSLFALPAAASEGGAVYLAGGVTAFEAGKTVFLKNTAKAGRGGHGLRGAQNVSGGAGGTARGGALFMAPGSNIPFAFNECELRENVAFAGPGGNGVDNVFGSNDGNGGRGGDAHGGAVYISRGRLNMNATTMVENAAIAGDGGPVERAPLSAGGKGGAASGGAIHATSETIGVTITGEVRLLDESKKELLSTSYLHGNAALGGSGKPGLGNNTGNDAGEGGDARGGALAIYCPELTLTGVLAKENNAQGGVGADGIIEERKVILLGPGSTGEAEYPEEVLFGQGGHNGRGYGGALFTSGANANIRDSSFVRNRAVGSRVVGRVVHLVGSENNGVRSISLPDNAHPMVAGRGAGPMNGVNGSWGGGLGGSGSGGAVYGNSGHLEVTGSSFVANEAMGGSGGAGGAVFGVGGGRFGGPGGGGGDARGGAFALLTGQTYRIRDSILHGNLAMAGRGGSGGKGGHAPADLPELGGTGGDGGKGGNALGGAIYSENPTASPQTEALLESCLISSNKAFGGDGSFGGNGGFGRGGTPSMDEQGGGQGGRGGEGGSARGGGVYAYQVHLSRSTLDRNLVSSGWGGSGGHGSAGSLIGGAGGPGGVGGNASGGGIDITGAVQASSTLEWCTVTYNEVHSGSGGTGGHGGISHYVGGDGSNGGNAGAARGGGIFVAGTTTPDGNVQIQNCSVAGNVVDGGSGGFRGLGMVPADEFDFSTVATRYQAGVPPMKQIGGILYQGPPFRSGATSFFVDANGYPIGFPPRTDGNAYAPVVSLQDSGNKVNFMDDNLEGQIVGVAYGVGGTSILTGGAVALGAVGFAAATSGSVVFGAAQGAVTVGAFAIGGAVTVAGPAIGIGGFFAIGLAVGIKAGYAAVETGDVEAAFAWALGAPGEVNRNDISLLLSGTGIKDEDDDMPEPQSGFHGVHGADAVPTGAGIYGAATIRNTLLAGNRGERRVRPTVVKTINSVRVVEFTENTQTVQIADYEGSGRSSGGNFIGAVGGLLILQGTDLWGVPEAPLDPKVASSVGDHGGSVPTLKLLPGSPARNVLTISQSEQSQNGYTWAAGSKRDVGAWGAPPNRPPVAVARYIRIRRGEIARFTLSELLAMQQDPDGDELVVTHSAPHWSGWTTITHPSEDPLLTEYRFDPPAGFPPVGAIFEFRTSDGEFESETAYVMLQLLADDQDCPAVVSERWLVLSGAGDYLTLPDSANPDHNFTGPFSVEFWYVSHRSTGAQAPEYEAFITKGNSAWRVQRNRQTGQVSFDVTGLEPLQLIGVSDLDDGLPHHIAAVYDGQYKYLYVDGRLEASLEVTGTPATNNQPVWIGANSERAGRYVAGAFDEVRIWSRALSHSEVRTAATHRVGFGSPGLLTWYRFEESGGPAVYNSAANGVGDPGILIWQDQIPQRVFSLPQTFAAVAGRHLFYNESALDGNDATANEADDNAIAEDKRALLPGELAGLLAGPATADHRSSYAKGLNGIMIDVQGLAQPDALGLEDFTFQRGEGGDPATWDPSEWPDAPSPAALLVREGAGPCDSHRITLIWDAADSGSAHAAVANGWLRVVLKAGPRTGLLSDEEFYFGHGTGEANVPPAFGGYSFTVSQGRAATVSLAKLLARASDDDGHALSVTGVESVSEAGGSVTLGEHTLTYTPPAGYIGQDSFEVTISDEAGASVTATVVVNVTAPAPGNGSNFAGMEVREGGEVVLLFYGIPGREYTLQFSIDLINWENRETVTAAENGRLEFTDIPPVPGDSGFYRTVVEP